MNKWTIGFVILLVAMLVFAIVFVSLSPDFVPPEEQGTEEGLNKTGSLDKNSGLDSNCDLYAPWIMAETISGRDTLDAMTL